MPKTGLKADQCSAGGRLVCILDLNLSVTTQLVTKNVALNEVQLQCFNCPTDPDIYNTLNSYLLMIIVMLIGAFGL